MVPDARPPSPGTRSIDLNADVGESFGRWTLGDDAALMPFLSSANVACGFHAGDPATIRRTCALAVHHGVAIGAQVGYGDLAGFGRRFIDASPDELSADVAYQIGGLTALAAAEGGTVTYVKPHGALYHAMSTVAAQAEAVAAGVAAVDPTLAVVCFTGSILATTATAAGLRVVVEGFADRRYGADGALVPRSESGSVLTDEIVVGDQAVRLALSDDTETICLHGDTPGAVGLARAVRARLAAQGISVAAFASPRV